MLLLNSVISHSTQVEMPSEEKISYLLKHLLVPLLILLVQANHECQATRTFYECSSQEACRSAKTFPHSSHKGQFRPISFKIPSNLVNGHWQWRQQGPNCPISPAQSPPHPPVNPFSWQQFTCRCLLSQGNSSDIVFSWICKAHRQPHCNLEAKMNISMLLVAPGSVWDERRGGSGWSKIVIHHEHHQHHCQQIFI